VPAILQRRQLQDTFRNILKAPGLGCDVSQQAFAVGGFHVGVTNEFRGSYYGRKRALDFVGEIVNIVLHVSFALELPTHVFESQAEVADLVATESWIFERGLASKSAHVACEAVHGAADPSGYHKTQDERQRDDNGESEHQTEFGVVDESHHGRYGFSNAHNAANAAILLNGSCDIENGGVGIVGIPSR
jgi:hypothetical protein